MKLLTWNTWKNSAPYDARLSAMTGLLAAAEADVVLLQEVFAGGMLDTAAHLDRALGLQVYPAPARRRPRPHGGAMVDSTNGLAVLSSGTPLEQTVLPLPSDPADPGRIAQMIRFDRLVVVNLHLTHLAGADDLRRAQAAHLLEALPAGIATVIGGDLNADPQSPALELLRSAGFRDLAAERPFATCGARRIDYLLVRDLAVMEVSVTPVGDKPVDGVTASDHVGVLADLTVAKN